MRSRSGPLSMQFLDELPCAVLVTDSAGSVVLANEALYSLAGGAGESWPGRSIDDLFPPAGRIFLQTHVWPILMREGSIGEVYMQVRGLRGESIPASLVKCVCEVSGLPAQFLGA